MRVTAELKIPDHLVTDLDAAYKQLLLFKQNNKIAALPKKLSDRIEYLRGYAKACRILQKMADDGTLLGINWMNFDQRIEKSLRKYMI